MALEFPGHPMRLVQRSVKFHLIGRLRRLMLRGGAALRNWASLEDNPFLQRALRVEARKYKPLLTILATVILAGLMLYAEWRLWELATNALAPSTGAPPRWRGRPRRGPSLSAWPRALGGNFISCAAILTSAACAYVAIAASRARTAYLLRQEVFKGTLDQLQLLPILEERWLWMMNTHPTALSLLIGATGLPVYCLALYTGQWSVLDFVGLGLVFLFIGHVLPAWQPAVWKQKNLKGQRPKFDLKTWQASLKQARGDLDPGLQPIATMTPAQRLEMQRRTQRMMSGLYEITPTGATGEGVPTHAGNGAASSGRKSGKTAGKVSFGAGSTQFSNGLSWFLGWIGLQVFIQAFMGSLFGVGRIPGPFGIVWGILPKEVTPLLPAFPFTWPLMLARLIVTPLPFFAFALSPVVIVVPLWIGFLQQRFTTLASNVSSLETFWTPRRARKRRAIGAALFLGLVIFFFGYGWDLLIVNGTLALLLRFAPLAINWALAALWTLAIVAGTVIASASLDATFKRFYQDEITLDSARRLALAGVLRAFALTIGTYFLFCWMGGQRGVNGVWLARLAPTLGTAVAYVLADFGTTLLQAVVPGQARENVKTLRSLWVYGLLLLAIAYMMWDVHLGLSFHFEQAPLVLLSPVVSLFALFRFELTRPSAAWWGGPLAQAAIGSICLAIASGYHLHTATPTEIPTPSEVQAHWSDILMTPLRALNTLARKVILALLYWVEQVNRTLREWNEWIVQRGIKYDNAVLTAELRRRVQREYWLLQWPVLLLFEAGAFLLIADPGVLVGLPWQGTWMLPISYEAWGTGVVIGVLGVALAIAILSTFMLGQAFDREHANGTLLFLFLTPMTDAAILLGKFVPGVFYSGLLLSTGLPWLLFGCLAGMAGGSLIPVGLAGVGFFFILASWLFAACLQMLCAIYANKPTEGMAVAVVLGLFIEAICWILIIVLQGWFLDPIGLRFEGSILAMWFFIMSLMHLTLAYVAWKLSLWLLRRQRYGDVLTKSTRLLRILADKLSFIRPRPNRRTSPQPHDASL